jgi:hypothetical protein
MWGQRFRAAAGLPGGTEVYVSSPAGSKAVAQRVPRLKA